MGEMFSCMFTKRSLRRCPDDSSTFDLAFTCTNAIFCPSGRGEPFFSFPPFFDDGSTLSGLCMSTMLSRSRPDYPLQVRCTTFDRSILS